jgi:Flp pilus assembly protein TadD
MKHQYWKYLLALALLASFSTKTQAQSERGPMRAAFKILVFVRVNNVAAPTGINVRLEADEGGLVDQQMTDASGKVAFVPKAPAGYSVVIHERGYQNIVRHVDLSLTPTAAVNLELVPIPGESPAADGIAISTDKLAIPEPARKEFEMGQKLLEQKHDASGSIGHFQKAIKLYDNFPQAYTLLGFAYLQDKKLPESRTALEHAVQLDAQAGSAYVALGGCLNQLKDYTAAEKALIKGIELLPESPEAHYELARSYWAMHRWQEAEPHAVKAEKVQPDNPGVRVLMGNILLQKQDAAGALKEFNEYLRLDPHGPMSDPVRAMVAKLEKGTAQHD